MTGPWVVAFVSLSVAVLVLILIVLGVLRQLSGPLATLERRIRSASITDGFGGLPPGVQVPPFLIADEEGNVLGSAEFLVGTQMVVFLEETCEPCQSIARILQSDLGREQIGVPLAAILPTPEDGFLSELSGSEIRCFTQVDHSVSTAFRNMASPQAFLLVDDLVIAKSIPKNVEDLQAMGSVLDEVGLTEDSVRRRMGAK